MRNVLRCHVHFHLIVAVLENLQSQIIAGFGIIGLFDDLHAGGPFRRPSAASRFPARTRGGCLRRAASSHPSRRRGGKSRNELPTWLARTRFRRGPIVVESL